MGTSAMPLINKTSRLFYLPFFAGGLPFMLISVTSLSQLMTGSATWAEVSMPFLMMTALSVAIFLIMGLPLAGLAAQENAAIRRLIDEEHWARWPQYRSEDDWRSYAERRYKTDLEGAGFSWLPVIVVTVLIGIAVGVPAMAGAFKDMDAGGVVTLIAAMGAFYLFVLAIAAGGGVLKKFQAEATYKRRLASAVPSVYIGKKGLYDEDKGYQEFGGWYARLVGVEYKESSPASLTFKLIVRYSMGTDVRHDSRTMGVTESVKVLADYREEAKALAERFRSEGLVRKA